MSNTHSTYYVVVCPSGGIVHTIRTPIYVSCWPGEGPLNITKFKTREQAQAAIDLALLNAATARIAAQFVIATVEIGDPAGELTILTDLAVAWRSKPIDTHGELRVLSGAQWDELQEKRQTAFQAKLDEVRKTYQRHYDN